MRARFQAAAVGAWILLAGAAPAPAQIRFTNVARSVGINYYGYQGSGVLAIDVTGDGYADLLFCNSEHHDNHFYVNNRDGTFTEVGAQWGVRTPHRAFCAVFSDMDDDGRLDLVMPIRDVGTVNDNRIRLLRNVGGRFEDVAAASGMGEYFTTPVLSGVTTFDADNDGDLELYVGVQANYNMAQPFGIVYECLLPGQFRLTSPCMLSTTGDCRNWQTVAADLNADGWTDLFVAEDTVSRPRVFLNGHNGTFVDVARSVGVGAPRTDMGVALGDYDNDGDFDLFTTCISVDGGPGQNRFLRNELQSGAFTLTTLGSAVGVANSDFAWGTTFFDYDNDGWPDLAVACQGRGRIYRNLGNATFLDVGQSIGFAPTTQGFGIAAVDYDRDGDLDLAMENHEGYASLWRNDGGNSNHWLDIRLENRTGKNVFAVGAVIRVTANGTTQTQQVMTGASFFSQEPFTRHFGLAGATTAERVDVRWPDGTHNSYLNVPANQEAVFRRLQGDFDGDGVVDAADIGPFIDVLMGLDAGWERTTRADMNHDGTANLFDIQGFVDALDE